MLGAVPLTFFIRLIIFCVQVLYAVDGGEHCGDKKQRNRTFSKLYREWGEESSKRQRLRKGSFLIEDS